MEDDDELRRVIAALRAEIATLLARATEAEAALASAPRRALEEVQRESERRYRKLIEDLPEPVLVHIDRKIAFANEAAALAAGLASADQLIGRSVLELATHSTRSEIASRMETVIEHGKHLALAEQSFHRPDGSTLHVEVKSIAIVYDGQPQR